MKIYLRNLKVKILFLFILFSMLFIPTTNSYANDLESGNLTYSFNCFLCSMIRVSSTSIGPIYGQNRLQIYTDSKCKKPVYRIDIGYIHTMEIINKIYYITGKNISADNVSITATFDPSLINFSWTAKNINSKTVRIIISVKNLSKTGYYDFDIIIKNRN